MRQLRQMRKRLQQAIAGFAVRMPVVPVGFTQQAPVFGGRRDADIVQQAGTDQPVQASFRKAEQQRRLASDHRHPFPVLEVVDADQIEGVGERQNRAS